ncbi:MAG: hypothetical protein K0U93_31235 [Gammaproteobacteria bacterium]|nr:hypothetical protein [Gammaproteobacteria bacterium]
MNQCTHPALRTVLGAYALLLISTHAGHAAPPALAEQFENTLATTAPVQRKKLITGQIGMGLIPRNYNATVEGWLEVLKIAKHLGVHVLQMPSGYWREDEPIKHAYQWDATKRLMDALDLLGSEFDLSQDIGGPFFHDRNMAPDYLQPIALTNPVFTRAYIDYLESYMQRFGSRVTRLLIHAEGSYSYFTRYPTHLAAYGKLLNDVRRTLKRKWPQLRVGVNIDPHNKPEVLATIAKHVDFVGFDIVQIDGVLESPTDLDALIQSVLAHTSGKPVTLAAGWSSAPGLGGGDRAQHDFYREVFKVLRKYRDRVEYVAVGPPFDEDPAVVGPAYRAQFSHLPKDYVANILEWATNLGLIRIDGTAKPAFNELLRLIKNYYRAH